MEEFENEVVEVIVEGEIEQETEIAQTADTALDDEALYLLVAENEAVKNRVIADYLAAIGKGIRLITAKGASVSANAEKPKTLGKASELAMAYFKKIK